MKFLKDQHKKDHKKSFRGPRDLKIGEQLDMVIRFNVVENEANPSSSLWDIWKTPTGKGYPFPASENPPCANCFM